ncbi:MAG: putative ATPase/class 3 adenylate cyclase [Candidatus Aldehydirespiratoraceae bacterium]|jgi:predicted ATPase/class 3 adenylate cyclase
MSQPATPQPPSGVVTFLFTDVEGSTRLWAEDADAMSASLQAHDTILRGSFESRGGFVFTTAGDSFAVAFAKTTLAVEAAIASQEALANAVWPGPALRVRMGLHLGEAEERGGDYFGPVVNACARVEAAGHGGQVLVTGAVHSILDRDDTQDLGSHRLRDLPESMRLFQVGAGDFAALRGLVSARDSLPPRRTRLLGRDREIAELSALVAAERLVTLVGPGGIGKTSLAVEAAGRVSAQFSGGVHFADLAPVSDPDEIVVALCRGVQLSTTTTPYEELRRHLSTQDTLVIVDNCEHIIDDVAEVVDRLLSDVPNLHLLATSREHLDLDGERVVRVGPLASEVGSAAVRLFVERVVASNADFNPTAADLELISAICSRLDGLPLAIELAAGRARSMSLTEIETGLSDRFALLAGSRRGKLRRQQTLRAAFDWSIELLEPAERDLLACLAVFLAPFSLPAAAAVGAQTTHAATDAVASLTAKSLVERVDDSEGEARYRLLETVREWGLEELARQSLLREVRDRHAHWYVQVAESMDHFEWATIGDSQAERVVDAMAAAGHLRDTDLGGAALILTLCRNALVENGFGPAAREIQVAARAQGLLRLPVRQWSTDHATRMDLMDGLPYDDPPPEDDGTFEWRYQVGGERFENAGLSGWYRTWLSPGRVVKETRALPPAAADDEAQLIRAFGLANAVIAFVHMGYFEEAVEAFDESRRIFSQLGRRPATIGVEVTSFAAAGICLGIDLRQSGSGDESLRGNHVLRQQARTILKHAPEERQVALALTARKHCLGRYPGEESAYLSCLGFYAITDGDLERGAWLSDTLVARTPATFSLKRHNLIRARGESLDLIADQRHHQIALQAESATADGAQAVSDLNRRKLHDEIARILD